MAAVLAAAAFSQAACTPVDMIVGAGATAGVAASQDRGVGGAIGDTRLQAAINKKWLDHSFKTYWKLTTTVYGGRVLITGIVADEQTRAEAVRLAYQVEGVKEVINEIVVGTSGDWIDQGRDAEISTTLRANMTFDSKISAIDISVDTTNGIVYLLGIARSQEEVDRIINYARNIRYVRGIKSYLEIRVPKSGNQPSMPEAPNPTSAPGPAPLAPPNGSTSGGSTSGPPPATPAPTGAVSVEPLAPPK